LGPQQIPLPGFLGSRGNWKHDLNYQIHPLSHDFQFLNPRSETSIPARQTFYICFCRSFIGSGSSFLLPPPYFASAQHPAADLQFFDGFRPGTTCASPILKPLRINAQCIVVNSHLEDVTGGRRGRGNGMKEIDLRVRSPLSCGHAFTNKHLIAL
jgi:hypothetical protein